MPHSRRTQHALCPRVQYHYRDPGSDQGGPTWSAQVEFHILRTKRETGLNRAWRLSACKSASVSASGRERTGSQKGLKLKILLRWNPEDGTPANRRGATHGTRPGNPEWIQWKHLQKSQGDSVSMAHGGGFWENIGGLPLTDSRESILEPRGGCRKFAGSSHQRKI